ncbi:MAG: sigma 54-interacting transcriptional regulator [Lachnospiraceae bacterium]|nr:sigma 54-interacting transcriptional regulator [Lachnospiraceae bacterium]
MENEKEKEIKEHNFSEDINKLFQTNWDVIYASDSRGITLEVSAASKMIWGMEAESLIGKSVYELEKEKIYYPSVTRMVLESKRRVQAIQTTATGKKLLVLGTPIKDENGEIIRVINTSRLIVDENELYRELEEANLLVEGYKRELIYARSQERQEVPFIANSVQMRNVASLAMKVSETDIAVIITGESGVGKEVLANYIHSVSSRREGPYIKINCGAIPPTLMESEIFGYEKGAFTGAERSGKAGIFELANHGTLFLDEIGEIPITLQSKLLRVLQENEFMRVGGTKPISVDVRVIAATNKDLLEEVKRGNFRKDLYYRLNVVEIRIPPLRDRKDDILPLSMFFLEKYNKKYKMDKMFSTEVINSFMSYRWEGNIRELQNTVERMVVLSPTNVIQRDSLPDSLTGVGKSSAVHVDEIIPLREAHRMVEDMLIEMAGKKYATTTQMAEALGVDQSTISRKLKRKK